MKKVLTPLKNYAIITTNKGKQMKTQFFSSSSSSSSSSMGCEVLLSEDLNN